MPALATRPFFESRTEVLGALAVYVALVGALTYPLSAHLSTHLPHTGSSCDIDLLYIAWTLAFESHALVGGASHFTDANIFYPAGHTLFLGDTAFGALPYFMPVFLLTRNPTLAINVVLLGGFILTAWALHLAVLHWTGSHLGGFIAGWTLLTQPWLWTWTPSAPTYAVLQYFPLIILFAATPAAGPRALWLAPLVVLQCLSDVVYVAAAVLVPLSLLAVFRTLRPATRRAGLHLLGVLGLCSLALVPVYGAHLAILREHLIGGSFWGTSTLFRPHTPLPWGPFSWGPLAVPGVVWALIAVGAVSAALSAHRHGGVKGRSGWVHGGFWAVTGLYLSLGPVVAWRGTLWQLPHARLANAFRVYDILRGPIRLAIAGVMGVAILAGLAFAECERRLPERAGAVARGAALLVVGGAMYAGFGNTWVLRPRTDIVPGSYPVAKAITDSPLTAKLREGRGPIVELPVGDRPAGQPTFHARAMYRSIFHWRPLLNGYSSYWPAGFPQRLAVAARLPDADAVASLSAETGLAAVVVHLADLDAAKRSTWLAIADQGARTDLQLVIRDGDDLLFSVAH